MSWKSWASLFFCIGVLLVARYMPHPTAAFVADDWVNLARAESYRSVKVAVLNGLRDPNRPLSMAALDAIFYWFGDAPKVYTAISIFGNTLILGCVYLLAYGLTRKVGAGLTAGLFFAVCPNITETTQWSTQVINEVLCALVGYAASACFFLAYARGRRMLWLVVSVITYAGALFSYESGLFLPIAYPFLLTAKWISRATIRPMLPFAMVVGAYAIWRLTNAFGFNTVWYYPPHMDVRLNAFGLLWNAWQIVHWWAGEHLIEAVLAGWAGFMQLAPWTRRGLLALNAALTLFAWLALQRCDKSDTAIFPPRIGIRFAIAWIAAAVAPLLISYTAPRLNVLPAIGFAVLLGVWASRAQSNAWLAFAAAPFFISLGALQGTTESYRQADEFNRRVYAHLREHREAWQSAEAIVFDTSGIRERQARRLIGAAGSHERTWAYFGNALLFRGFVPMGMLQMITRSATNFPFVIHDVENGARREGDNWLWHERFDPSRPNSTPADKVYYVDLLKVAMAER